MHDFDNLDIKFYVTYVMKLCRKCNSAKITVINIMK